MEIKRLAIWVDPSCEKDAIFNISSPLNRDNCLSTWILLKEKLAGKNWECRTYDIYKSKNIVPDAVLFMEMPRKPLKRLLGDWYGKTRNMVLLLECEVIRPWNWVLGNHTHFDAIFTWDERFVDSEKYFKINFSNSFTVFKANIHRENRKFCAVIAAHKNTKHQLELYSEREKSIRWFEKEHPKEFDLYGIGWDKQAFSNIFLQYAFNRIGFLNKLFRPKYPSYLGTVDSKNEILKNYKFSICYENAREIKGYITEKIFDCFFAGCIPIYWGAPDIQDYIPKECFIDRREFKTHESLYKFLKDFKDSDRLQMTDSARKYLQSRQSFQFTNAYFAQAILMVVSNE